GLALGGVAEQASHIRVTLHVSHLGEVQVTAVGLGLAGERLLEVLVGGGALELCHRRPPLLVRAAVFVARGARAAQDGETARRPGAARRPPARVCGPAPHGSLLSRNGIIASHTSSCRCRACSPPRPGNPLTRMEKASGDRASVATYPDSADTPSRVPVLARTRPAAGPRDMRRLMVPSTPPIDSEVIRSGPKRKSRCTAARRSTICRGLKRLEENSPEPLP